jgi:hypothetical protein
LILGGVDDDLRRKRRHQGAVDAVAGEAGGMDIDVQAHDPG